MKTVTLTWNEVKNRWDMSYDGHFVMDFPDCKNMTMFFRPHKSRVNKYNLKIERAD